MNNKKKKLVLAQRILKLAIEITNDTKTDVFVNYSGHVDYIEVRVFLQGWKENSDISKADYKQDIWFSIYKEKECLKQLEETIKYLEEVQKNEINSL